MPLAAGAVQSAEPIAVHGVPIAGPSETRLLQPAQFEGDPLLLMLPDSLNLIRGQQKLEANRDALEHNPETPVAGNPEGDVTVVEFFDYRCPYCRRFAERLETMFEADPGVRFVFKDWPMFGGASVTAARAALAAARQGQYLAMHEALMATRLLTEDVIVMKAEELGLDTKRLQADMASQDIDRQLAATALDRQIQPRPIFGRANDRHPRPALAPRADRRRPRAPGR